MKIGFIQYSPEWENVEANISTIESIVNKNVTNEDVLVLSEMCLTGFTMSADQFAEEIDGPGMKYFISLSQRIRKEIFAGIIERDGDNFYNSLIHFDKNGLIKARYRKIHPFSYGKEDKAYTAGNEIVISNIDKLKIGMTVCYDLRFPELFRLYGKERTEIIINAASWPIPRIEHYTHLLKARAIENQCYVIGANRTGNDKYSEYNGSSAIYGPIGEEILLCPDEEGLFSAEIEIAKVKETRERFPILNDMKLL